MKFIYYKTTVEPITLTEEQVREHLSEHQIEEGIRAKQSDPNEEVSYMTVGGYIGIEL